MKKKITGIILVAMMLMTACSNGAQQSSEETTVNSEATASASSSETSVVAESSAESSSAEEETGTDETGENRPAAGGGEMGTDKNDDEELQAMLSETVDKFTLEEYTDEETGLTVPYNIYLPDDYDESKSYPMVVFIGDMTTVGTDTEYSLTQGWGGVVWATSSEQEKHESIVLVPVYPETILDDHDGYTTTDYVNLTPGMIKYVSEKYSVDTDRIYGTGQSMGAMTTLYLAAHNPDLYAAVLIVDGQWDVSEIKGIEDVNMIYIAAGGDENAFNGQSEVKAMFDEDGVPYSEVSGLDAQSDRAGLEEAVSKMLAEGNSHNFITWEAGTVLKEGQSSEGAAEHMASFDYGYKLESVRDWIFSQTK